MHHAHVAVEFPLCHTALEADALLALARSWRRVLHLEFIGLLSSSHLGFREQLQGRPVQALRSTFRGGLYRWVAEEVQAGRVGQLAAGRLHAERDLLGPLRLLEASLQRPDGGMRLQITLEGPGGVRATLDERRVEGRERQGRLEALLDDGGRLELHLWTGRGRQPEPCTNAEHQRRAPTPSRAHSMNSTRLMHRAQGACYDRRAVLAGGLAKAMGRAMPEQVHESDVFEGGSHPQETDVAQANCTLDASLRSPGASGERAQRRAFLAWMRENAPDVWRLSEEVDLSLVLWMRSLPATGRIACIENFNRFIEVARAAPRSR